MVMCGILLVTASAFLCTCSFVFERVCLCLFFITCIYIFSVSFCIYLFILLHYPPVSSANYHIHITLRYVNFITHTPSFSTPHRTPSPFTHSHFLFHLASPDRLSPDFLPHLILSQFSLYYLHTHLAKKLINTQLSASFSSPISIASPHR